MSTETKIVIYGPRDKIPSGFLIDVTTRSTTWTKTFSPFLLGPCPLYDEYMSKTMENAWQYSKVYNIHINEYGDPTEEYWKWAQIGWNKTWADRYPMGKGATPLYSLWNGKKLNYIDARKQIYVPLYIQAVLANPQFEKLYALVKRQANVAFFDYDGYNEPTKTFEEVLNDPSKKMGHAFILAEMLHRLIF